MSGLGELLGALARALALTALLEVALALAFLRERSWRAVAMVALAQVVTNPLANIACMRAGWTPFDPFPGATWLVVACVEAAACVVEGFLYRMADVSDHPWLMSVMLNAASFGLGMALSLL